MPSSKTAPKPAARAQPRKRCHAINELMDVIGQKWTLRILWELRGEPLNFRALQERGGGLSPTVLNRRLRELRDADLVELSLRGYVLTALGRELGAKLLDLTGWAERWAKKRRPAAEIAKVTT